MEMQVSATLTPEQVQQLLSDWYVAKEAAIKAKNHEVVLRHQLIAHFFPEPVEGSKNAVDIGYGCALVGTLRYTRTVDMAALDANRRKFNTKKNFVPVDELIDYTPKLVKKVYDSLTEAQRKLFDEVVTSKPQLMSLKIKTPNDKPGDDETDETATDE